MIPIMEREFVDRHKWMGKQEFMDIMVVAQATPGIFAIDMASHIGYKLRGIWGGIVGAIGIALPSIIAIIIIAMFFRQFKDNYWVEKFFAGIRPAVVALIASAGLTILWQVLFQGLPPVRANFQWLGAALFAAAFVILRKLRWSPILVMALCGAAGLCLGLLGLG